MARGDNTAEMKFRLPGELHARIEAAAAADNRSASEEVRQRLERSFEGAPPEAADVKTSEFLAAVSEAASDIRDFYGKSWHEDPWARDALSAALRALVEIGGPPGKAEFNPAPGSRATSAEHARDPLAFGEVIALKNPFPQTGWSSKS